MTPDPAVADRPAPTVVTPVLATSPERPSWISLRAEPSAVALGRRFAADVVSGHTLDADHAYTIRLLVSELLTNAVRAALDIRPTWPRDAWPIRLDVAACNRWTYLAVTDPDYRPLPAPALGGLLAENGRGLAIVDQAADARWTTYASNGQSKTVHLLVAAPGAVLTDDELATIGVPA